MADTGTADWAPLTKNQENSKEINDYYISVKAVTGKIFLTPMINYIRLF